MNPELRVSMAVFDPKTDMPGVITAFSGNLVRLARPSGRIWYATRISVRPATAWERRQLRALADHHRKQLGRTSGRTPW
ncbi:hypothetical protein ACIQ7D_37345 [Streptomyces sp. NPDC096310]|uniref:hypothetical protein n=1 Tax=Streptomyces sp. NPDC096310 TaxID=3366082 RepID=UPI003804B8FB